jgi:Rab9 effector protein with kelch motifs
VYNKNLYIFGGEKKYNEHLKQRECLSDIKIFNLEKYAWRHTRAGGDIVTPRRNHTAAMASKI